MKKILYLIILILYNISAAQVGIDTDEPEAKLDINGDLKIRKILELPQDSLPPASVLVQKDSIVRRMPINNIISSSMPTAIKGIFAGGGSTISLNLLNGESIIPFDTVKYDEGGNFDVTNHNVTIQNDGLYFVNLQLRLTTLVGIGSDLGVKVRKNGNTILESSYTNVSILGIDATPPIRNIHSIVQLEAGDELSFHLTSDLLSLTVNLVGSEAVSFFNVLQLR